MIHFVLLSGGSGTRLWPLSNKSRSKQFLKVLRDESDHHVSMVQRVYSQIKKVDAAFDITIATSESQQQSLMDQLGENNLYTIVLEPERRDTAAAIMLACANIEYNQGANSDDTVIVLPIDSFADQDFYNSSIMLDKMIQKGVCNIALLGAKPLYPSAKYGYIVPEHSVSCSKYSLVSEFCEKPSETEAANLIKRGALWNCGVFAFKLSYISQITKRYVASENFNNLIASYSNFPKISFDYEVVEKESKIAVTSYSGYWKDLGTWNTLSDEMADEIAGKAIVDQKTCRNVHVINETNLPIVVAGLEDSIVVATPDGILVSSKSASVGIKNAVNLVAELRPMYERRRWGEYRVLDAGSSSTIKTLVKELIIKPDHQLSYQRHFGRTENWTVTSGSGEVVLNDEVIAVHSGSMIEIPKGTMHSVRAFDELHIIEVQFGDVLEESDIERLGFYW